MHLTTLRIGIDLNRFHRKDDIPFLVKGNDMVREKPFVLKTRDIPFQFEILQVSREGCLDRQQKGDDKEKTDEFHGKRFYRTLTTTCFPV